jgi:sugar O-acyltransferase (sialic acid O-acetyltransferase NeuD family)
MKCLAILGAGGHGKVVADAALLTGWDEIHFYDAAWPQRIENSRWTIVGNGQSLINQLEKYEGVIVAIGDNQIRWEEHTKLVNKNAKLVSIIHPSAELSTSAVIGCGTVVLAKSVINIDTKIGDACIVNTGSTIDHDCIVEDSAHICPGVNISGSVSVGFGCWIGVGASVKQGVNIGRRSVVGAGAVVIADVLDCLTVVGNPAKQIVYSK